MSEGKTAALIALHEDFARACEAGRDVRDFPKDRKALLAPTPGTYDELAGLMEDRGHWECTAVRGDQHVVTTHRTAFAYDGTTWEYSPRVGGFVVQGWL